uniref:Myb/SANT-like domain-containing protein n=1 Tax=Lactuca sativa TaxID=4236 RepID=A0A9R1UGU5_LACSA|nr:hypothetical protein LSAT_V11C900476220 [Lactuca sativa]
MYLWLYKHDLFLTKSLISIGGNHSNVGVMEKSRKYRNWTITEDAKLVETLINMVNMRGFKEKIPSLGKPHIELVIKTMKKDWQAVYDTVNDMNTNGSKKRKRVDVVIKEITIATNAFGEKLEKAANSTNQAILGET